MFYKTADNNWLMDENGIHYETMEDLLCGVLGFCGCGAPDLALKYVRDTMRLILKNHSEEPFNYERKREEDKKLHGTDAKAYVIWYLLDNKGLTEHGGSVNNAWLTEKGTEVLVELEVFDFDN